MTESSTAPRRGRDVRLARARAQAVKYPYIRRKLPAVELLSSEAVAIIEDNAETILEEIGIEFRRDPGSLRLWRAAGADVSGERVHIPRGLARRLLESAPREFTLYARNPARNVRFGGDATVFSPVGGPPFVYDIERGRRYGTLEDLAEFHQARAHGARHPFLRRKHVRADGDCAQQAPPRRAVLVLPLQRPGLRGDPGDGRARARCRGARAGAVRRGVPGDPSGGPRQHQFQLAAGVRRTHARSAARVRGREPGHHRGAGGARRCDGPRHRRRLSRGDPRRNPRGHGADANRAAGRSRHPRLVRGRDFDAYRGADIRYARGDADDLCHGATRATARRALSQRRLAVLVQDRRCAGGVRERPHAPADSARGSEPGHACGGLARGRSGGGLREIRHGRRPARDDAEPRAGNGSIARADRRSMRCARSGPEATFSAVRTRRRTSRPRSTSRRSPTIRPTSNGRSKAA